MNINSRSINANDLDSVYDYFDNVVNQMIRNETDTDNFPTLQEFAISLGDLIDRLDALMQDINPRVEAYLASKSEEEQLKRQLEELKARLGDNLEQRRNMFGGGGNDGGGIYDVPSDSFYSDSTSAVIESPSLIDFDTSIEDMMTENDTNDLFDKQLFDDEAAEMLKQKQEETIDDEELMEDLNQALNPMDLFSGKTEMDERGDHYTELLPEIDLYNDDEDDEDDAEDEDEFGFGFPSTDGYTYEDDPDDSSESDSDDGFFASNDLFDDDDDYDDNYDDDYDDRDRDEPDQSDDALGDWDDDNDPFGGRNIDQLLSSASMTI